MATSVRLRPSLDVPTATLIPPTIIALPNQPGAAAAPPDVSATPANRLARYVFPLRPLDDVSYGACHHDYPASDIFAPRGTAFVAVTAGTVEWVSRTDEWDPAVDDPATRSGLAVSIRGDDGIRYYGSHLATVADGLHPGQRVLPGMVLGTVGTSGNAAATPPHVHFGLSEATTPNDWQIRRGLVSPITALNAWKIGASIAPEMQQPRGGVC